MKFLTIVLCTLALSLNACAFLPTPTPTPTATALPTKPSTATPRPTETSTQTLTPLPTSTVTSTPKPNATATHTRTRTPTLTRAPALPSPTPSIAQICAGMIGKVGANIYVMYIQPTPELIWDTIPRQFLVGLCNTNPPPSTPQGKYKISMTFPPGNSGATQSAPSLIELKPGFNEVSIGPWVPGLRNHLADCASRAEPVAQVIYNDTPDPLYRVLPWYDGRDSIKLFIKCGGNFP